MKKALVTGASGFIGAHVVRVLLKRGISVRALLRPTSRRENLAGLEVEAVEGNLTDSSSLRKAVAGCDGLFHVAADYRLSVRDPRELYRNNVDGTRTLLEEALRAGVANVVYTSSVSAVGHPRGTSAPGREADFPDISAVIGHYKRSKCLAEEVARDYAKKGLRVVIVNPSTPIGPFDIKPTPTGRIVVDFLNGKMPAYMETGLNFVSVADVAEGHWLASQKGKPGERYILGNTNMMLKEFLALLAEIAGLPAPRIRIPYAIGYCIGAIDTWTSRLLKREPRVPLEAVRMARHLMFFDASRAIRELGLPQTPVRQALREAVEWFIAHGYAKNTIATRTAV